MRIELLREIFSQPTAPFRELHVISRVEQALDDHKVPHFLDPVGNLVIGVDSMREYFHLLASTREPLRVFMAHMDHPGFHGVRWIDERNLWIQWHGGSPVELLEGASVWVANDSGWIETTGRLNQIQLSPTGKKLDQAQITFDRPLKTQVSEAKRLFGGFKFHAPVWEEGDLLYTKAADDLGGCFAIVSTALDLWSHPKHRSRRRRFLGLLTRAEEVGFIGAIGHFQLGWMEKSKRPIVVVSLETSRTLPGAEFGKGPVMRLGDRATVFSPGALKVLIQVAEKKIPGRYQKRIMDGGSCEATAATAFGYTAIGMSVPLGNYHNQSFEGGPDSRGPLGPAPEYINKKDIQGMIEVCHGLLDGNLPWNTPWKGTLLEFKKSFKNYRPLLKG